MNKHSEKEENPQEISPQFSNSSQISLNNIPKRSSSNEYLENYSENYELQMNSNSEKSFQKNISHHFFPFDSINQEMGEGYSDSENTITENYTYSSKQECSKNQKMKVKNKEYQSLSLDKEYEDNKQRNQKIENFIENKNTQNCDQFKDNYIFDNKQQQIMNEQMIQRQKKCENFIKKLSENVYQSFNKQLDNLLEQEERIELIKMNIDEFLENKNFTQNPNKGLDMFENDLFIQENRSNLKISQITVKKKRRECLNYIVIHQNKTRNNVPNTKVKNILNLLNDSDFIQQKEFQKFQKQIIDIKQKLNFFNETLKIKQEQKDLKNKKIQNDFDRNQILENLLEQNSKFVEKLPRKQHRRRFSIDINHKIKEIVKKEANQKDLFEQNKKLKKLLQEQVGINEELNEFKNHCQEKLDEITYELIEMMGEDLQGISLGEISSFNQIIQLIRKKLQDQQELILQLKKEKIQEQEEDIFDFEQKNTQKRNTKQDENTLDICKIQEQFQEIISQIYMEEHSKQFYIQELFEMKKKFEEQNHLNNLKQGQDNIMNYLNKLNQLVIELFNEKLLIKNKQIQDSIEIQPKSEILLFSQNISQSFNVSQNYIIDKTQNNTKNSIFFDEKNFIQNLMNELYQVICSDTNVEKCQHIIQNYYKILDKEPQIQKSQEISFLTKKIVDKENENQILKDEKQVIEMKLKYQEQKVLELEQQNFKKESSKLSEYKIKILELQKSLSKEKQMLELKNQELNLKNELIKSIKKSDQLQRKSVVLKQKNGKKQSPSRKKKKKEEKIKTKNQEQQNFKKRTQSQYSKRLEKILQQKLNRIKQNISIKRQKRNTLKNEKIQIILKNLILLIREQIIEKIKISQLNKLKKNNSKMSEYYFKSNNSKFNTYRSPYLRESHSNSKERFHKRPKISFSQNKLTTLSFRQPHIQEQKLSDNISSSKQSQKHFSVQIHELPSYKSKYRYYRKQHKEDVDQDSTIKNNQQDQSISREEETIQNQSKELNITPMTIPKEEIHFTQMDFKKRPYQRKTDFEYKKGKISSIENNLDLIMSNEGPGPRIQGNSQTYMARTGDQDPQEWYMIQNLKRQNFELNQLLERKKFEIQELEYEKVILEKKNKYMHSKMQTNQRKTISNKNYANRVNENLFISSLQILLNQGIRELNLLKNGQFEENIFNVKHIDKIQKVFNIIKDKFQNDSNWKEINLNGDLIPLFQDLLLNYSEGKDINESLKKFENLLNQSTKTYSDFIIIIQGIIEGQIDKYNEDQFESIEKNILDNLLEFIQEKKTQQNEENLQNQRLIQDYQEELDNLKNQIEELNFDKKEYHKKYSQLEPKLKVQKQDNQKLSNEIKELRKKLHQLKEIESNFQIFQLETEDQLKNKNQDIEQLLKKLEFEQKENQRLKKQVNELQDTNKFLSASKIQKSERKSPKKDLQTSTIKKEKKRGKEEILKISENNLEELFSQQSKEENDQSDIFDELECRSVVVNQNQSNNEEKLFKSVDNNQPEQNWQEQIEVEDSFEMDQVKELVNTLIEEKENIKKELSDEVYRLNEQISELLKEQKDYQIIIQKAKIDEIVKTQWKKERDDTKNQLQKLNRDYKKLEIANKETENQCYQLYQQLQSMDNNQDQQSKQKSQKEIQINFQFSNINNQIHLSNYKKRKNSKNNIQSNNLQEELNHYKQKTIILEEQLKEVEDNNLELIEINQLLKSRLDQDQQYHEDDIDYDEDEQKKSVSVSIFSDEDEEEVQYSNQNIQQYNLNQNK